MENNYLGSVIKQFNYYKTLGEKAMEQLNDEMLFWQYNADSNSIAIIVNHLAGNMLSRFTNFLTTDGEKTWRNRDSEFENNLRSRQEVLDHWNKGWMTLLSTIEQLSPADLQQIVYIRNESHTVLEAINRQLAHYPYHIGQIVFIAKMIKGGEWNSLSIGRNKSREYNEHKFREEKGK